jgi:hypothetical protein
MPPPMTMRSDCCMREEGAGDLRLGAGGMAARARATTYAGIVSVLVGCHKREDALSPWYQERRGIGSTGMLGFR